MWIFFYIVIGLLPLGLSLISLDPGRGFWINFSVALGFVALSMLGLQFALAARSRWVTDPVGMDATLLFHRNITWVVLLMVLAHPIILFVLDRRFVALLNVWSNPLRAKFALTSVFALVVLIVISIWRSWFRLSYSRWQALHAMLAMLIVITALLHALMVGYYITEPFEQILWVGLTALFILLVVWVRLIKPMVRSRRAWRVVDVREERGGAYTLELEMKHPNAAGSQPFHFEAGQFAWVIARKSPFAITFHPFSFSCSAENQGHVTFTIKTQKGFTRELTSLQPGETVYLDGPYGSFTMERYPTQELVLIGAGVGVTPLLSMASTIADRGEPVQCTMILANRDEQSITCFEQVEELKQRMDLKVIHVLSQPDDSWTGEKGRLDLDKMRRFLPDDPAAAQYFICGSPTLMDVAEGLLKQLDVPRKVIHAERFGMV